MKIIRSLLMCLLFVSVWLSPEPAQAIVGYVNVAFSNGYTFVAAPLKQFSPPLYTTPNNTLTNIIPSPPPGTVAYVWDITNQMFLEPAIYDEFDLKWTLNYDLPPGKGFVILSQSRWTNTFVGEVLTGTNTTFIAGANKFSLLGSKVPLPGPITSVLGFPGTDGDDVYFFRSASQSFSDAYTYHDSYGWFDPNNPNGVPGTGDPSCNVAESFFVQNPGPNTNWVQILNQFAGASSSLTTSATSTERKVSQININGGKVTLKLQDPGGGPYDVQFSADGLTWTTVAKNKSGDTWTGKLPDAMSGYFQVITSQTVGSAR